MTTLSPAAQAVIDAYENAPFLGVYPPENPDRGAVAAALRAATLNIFFEETIGMTAYGGYNQALEKVLAIATELEAQ